MLPEYYLKVWGAEQGYQVIFGHGENRADQRYVLLLKERDHYHGLTSITGFLAQSYYCHLCDKEFHCESYQHHPWVCQPLCGV